VPQSVVVSKSTDFMPISNIGTASLKTAVRRSLRKRAVPCRVEVMSKFLFDKHALTRGARRYQGHAHGYVRWC
jgi:hypothetical protein